MGGTVIIYSSFAGKTRQIAKYMAEKAGWDIFDLKLQTNIDLTSYDRIIMGTGVHNGNPYARVTRFVEDHADVFLDKDVALFVSCLYVGERAAKQCSEIAKEFHINNAVFFSTRGEKNEAGLPKDVDAFIERMKS